MNPSPLSPPPPPERSATPSTLGALVTGASGGIGLELAKLLARDGYALLLVARDPGRLEDAARDLRDRFAVPVRVVVADLADPAAPPAVLAAAQDEGLTIDVLVNNAGFASYGPFAKSDLDHELAMIRVNVEALTHLTRLVLPGMLDRRAGRILNVASTAAFFPGPLMAVYYATKAYVLSFSEALAEETRGSGVTVTALCPGPTATGFQQRASLEGSKLVSGQTLLDAAAVAAAGHRGLMRGDRVVVPARRDRLLVFVPRLLPRALLPRVVRRAQGPVEH